jgi:hypothetical protein
MKIIENKLIIKNFQENKLKTFQKIIMQIFDYQWKSLIINLLSIIFIGFQN